MSDATTRLGRGITATMNVATDELRMRDDHASNLEAMLTQAQEQITELEAELARSREANTELRRVLEATRRDLLTALAHLSGRTAEVQHGAD